MLFASPMWVGSGTKADLPLSVVQGFWKYSVMIDYTMNDAALIQGSSLRELQQCKLPKYMTHARNGRQTGEIHITTSTEGHPLPCSRRRTRNAPASATAGGRSDPS
ncbi:uncharacterized protein LAESUDRAFT_725850 [Laetiporus sulphureus 93-53]|uniref:Uncharacterized protein n=1 Tax=Laetiporus sulphureus 93-53 TaxID=1314785 RepID=A0A165E7V5_9APHY|nr:uncharacterized protein LAESUDRAFT_725850 [Laetiporus sulphureus 93-53]KZT06411.1 hypothetical protein LAESUDRAFT_725850 [Laetiporus sulphureus 93-53]